jgi:hypothetical protein
MEHLKGYVAIVHKMTNIKLRNPAFLLRTCHQANQLFETFWGGSSIRAMIKRGRISTATSSCKYFDEAKLNFVPTKMFPRRFSERSGTGFSRRVLFVRALLANRYGENDSDKMFSCHVPTAGSCSALHI